MQKAAQKGENLIFDKLDRAVYVLVQILQFNILKVQFIQSSILKVQVLQSNIRTFLLHVCNLFVRKMQVLKSRRMAISAAVKFVYESRPSIDKERNAGTSQLANPIDLCVLRFCCVIYLMYCETVIPIVKQGHSFRWIRYVFRISRVSFFLLALISFWVQSTLPISVDFISFTEYLYNVAAVFTLAGTILTRELLPVLLCFIMHGMLRPRIRFDDLGVTRLLVLHAAGIYRNLHYILMSPYYIFRHAMTWKDLLQIWIVAYHRLVFIGPNNIGDCVFVMLLIVVSSRTIKYSTYALKYIEHPPTIPTFQELLYSMISHGYR